MKIILWIGNEPIQKALANKIHLVTPISGIVTETRNHKRKLNIRRIFEKIIEVVFLRKIDKAWWDLQNKYNFEFINFPKVECVDVENINSQTTFEFTKKIQPDLILVSGTRLIKENLLSLNPSIGILNLHTGLSPYIKGGPNCTNWCIASRQYHLIGNTIMWIDKGIDTGNILTTETTSFFGNETLFDTHVKVMEHAHQLYIKAIISLSTEQSNSIKQSEIAKGVTFYSKQWNLKYKFKLLFNLKEFNKWVSNGKIDNLRSSIKTVPLVN
jgi:folate-dependent phosphoribosylglycinamide formyltransferase PurN